MLRRFSGRRAAAEAPAVAARWDELRRSAPELAEGIALQRAVQRLQRAADLAADPPPYTRDAAEQRLAAGISLLQGSAPFVEVGAVEQLFHRLCHSAVRGEAVVEAKALQTAIAGNRFDLPLAVRAACALDSAALGDLFSALGERAVLARTLLDHALAPALHAAALAYAPLLESAPWTRSVCPVCGAVPLLGELRGGESRRVLRCGRCGAAWEFQRLRCVSCDTRDHRWLSALHVEGEADFLRIEVCEACFSYIKSMARLDPIPYELLPAEDLATAHLDLLAIEHGYARPHKSV